MKTNIRFCSYLAQFFLEIKCYRQNCTENESTHFVFSYSPSPLPENRAAYEIT